MQRQAAAPSTPRVVLSSPTPTEPDSSEYFPEPSVRRSTRLQKKTPDTPAASSDPDVRARSKGRDDASQRRRQPQTPPSQAAPNGNLLSPPARGLTASLRSLSRSPSPLGLIPIHTSWRTFVHKHEIPRKALHVSIGFVTLALYARGAQPAAIHPALLAALLPIAAVDVLRHHWPPFNRAYVRALGAFMRESEVHERYNGVIWYLLGAWAVLRFCPKDVAVVAVVLLSWCDTAASTVGRALGRYTPRLREGKSLAGSLAAAGVGVASAALFWGAVAPAFAARARNVGADAFAFQGVLALPRALPWAGAAVRGPAALGLLSLWAGFVASASEAVDLFGADDNFSIPILCGAGIWGFLRVFGSA